MGLTFIAAGVSVPDALSGIAVIKEGHGKQIHINKFPSFIWLLSEFCLEMYPYCLFPWSWECFFLIKNISLRSRFKHKNKIPDKIPVAAKYRGEVTKNIHWRFGEGSVSPISNGFDCNTRILDSIFISQLP